MESESSEDRKVETTLKNVSDTEDQSSTGFEGLDASLISTFEFIPTSPTSSRKLETEAIEPRRKRRRRYTKCCEGHPGRGAQRPVDSGRGNHCSLEIRMRGGSDTDRSLNNVSAGRFRLRSLSEDPTVFHRQGNHCCGRSPRMPIFEDRDAARFDCGYGGQLYNSAIREERARGGCGSCGGQAAVNPVSYRNAPISKKARFPCDGPPAGSYGAASQPKMKGACPCGGCGGPACSEDPDRGCAESADFKQPASGGCGGTASSQYPRYGEKENREEKSGGCCKTSRPRGNPCKCKCQSCEAPEPNGGCGGGSCGMMYSCSGSSAGRCCFPRNTKRRSGPECCGGGDPSCGGCC